MIAHDASVAITHHGGHMAHKKMLKGFQMALATLLKAVMRFSMMDSDGADGPAKGGERRVEGGKTTTTKNVQTRKR